MAKRKKIDWDAIKSEYRAGQISITEISKKHGCARETISRKASEENWQRDLSADVKKETKRKVTHITATSQITNHDVILTDDEIIDRASDVGKDIIISHRQDIAHLRDLEIKLIKELNDNPTKLYIAQYQGKIIEKVVGLTAAERAMAANNLANVQHKRIQLERQAFNLNDTGDIEDPVGQILNEVAKRTARLVSDG